MRQLSNGYNVIWEPLPGGQSLALSCPAQLILMHGSRASGKTDCQLMRFRRNVGLGYGKYWTGIIFDREYKNLDDVVSKSKRWFHQLKDRAIFKESIAQYYWEWPTGERLLFRSIKKPADYWNYHGHEYPFIGINELAKYPTEEIFEAMLSCNRSSFLPEDHPVYIDGALFDTHRLWRIVEKSHPSARLMMLPELPLEVFLTTNSYGPGRSWVKKLFIDKAEANVIVDNELRVFNPRIQDYEIANRSQVHIFSSYRENKYLNPLYIATLESITDENKRKSWVDGSWDVVSGGMFSDEWNTELHKVKPFNIPHTWKINRAFDYGSSRPFSVGWYAESDGSDFRDGDNVLRHSVKGDVYRIAEWYGSTGKANHGLRMLSSEISQGIIKRELAMGIHHRVIPGPADTSIWDVQDGKSIASEMRKAVMIDGKWYNGCIWTKANKGAGSRKAGWDQVRARLKAAWPIFLEDGTLIPRQRPSFYIFDTCRDTLALFPNVPRDESDPDDVDTESEDHIADEIRYRLMSSKTIPKGNIVKGILA